MKCNSRSLGICLDESRTTGTVSSLEPVFPTEVFDIFLTQWNIRNVLKAKTGAVSPAQDPLLVSRAFPMVLSGQHIDFWEFSPCFISISWKLCGYGGLFSSC